MQARRAIGPFDPTGVRRLWTCLPLTLGIRTPGINREHSAGSELLLQGARSGGVHGDAAAYHRGWRRIGFTVTEDDRAIAHGSGCDVDSRDRTVRDVELARGGVRKRYPGRRGQRRSREQRERG